MYCFLENYTNKRGHEKKNIQMIHLELVEPSKKCHIKNI